jgi:hypothetical protein
VPAVILCVPILSDFDMLRHLIAPICPPHQLIIPLP